MLNQSEIIKKNLHFILSHFNNQKHVFPRSIMTLKTKGPIFSDSEDDIFQHFLESEFKDCKINGYPLFDKDYDYGLSPSFIFIDLDLSICNTCKYPKRKLDYILKGALNKMEKTVNGFPTVLWTGNGYHIYLPSKLCSLEVKEKEKEKEKCYIESVSRYDNENSSSSSSVNNEMTTEFMKFTYKYFTDNHIDLDHISCINSFYVSVPGTINSKLNSKVELIQAWDGRLVDIHAIISSFLNNLEQSKSGK
jgi:hypothetical protein